MANFDPAAETARYLATLPPEAHQKAIEYTQGGHWLLLWGWLVSVAVAVVVVKWGVLARTEAKLEASKPRPWLAAFVISLIWGVLSFLLGLPWTAYANWWREKAYGLNNQTLPAWLGEQAIAGLIGVVMGAIFFSVFYWLVRRLPKLWPVAAGALTAGFMMLALFVAPIFIDPLFNEYKPAPPGAVRDLVVEMGKANGVPTDKIFIYDGSKQSDRYTANVAGLFGTARVAMSDTMFKKGADLAEVKAVVGHEMGHYVQSHIFWFMGVAGLLVMVGGFIAQWLYPRLRGLLGAANVGGVADPAGLPILMIIAATLGLLLTPVFSGFSRLAETDADNFSLDRAKEPDGLAKALVKTIEYRASSPSEIEEMLFYDHPSVERRVRNAMEWKAKHGGAPASPAPAEAAPTPPAAPAD